MISSTEISGGIPSNGRIASCASSCPIAVTHQTLYPKAAAARCADIVAAVTSWYANTPHFADDVELIFDGELRP